MSALKSLCKKGVSLAYFTLINVLLKHQKFEDALAVAKEADSKHD